MRRARRFPGAPASVPLARHFVRASLHRQHLDTADCELLVTELAANAVRHASSDFHVAIETDAEGQVHVEVGDASPDLPVANNVDDKLLDHGRGLRIVDAVATAWGVAADNGGKKVWFDLPAVPMAA